MNAMNSSVMNAAALATCCMLLVAGASRSPNSQHLRQEPPVGSVAAIATASTSVSASSTTSAEEPANRPASRESIDETLSTSPLDDDGPEDDRRPLRPASADAGLPARPKQRKPDHPTHSRPIVADNEDPEEEDCRDDNDYDWNPRRMAYTMATRPMRHLSRMMDSIFDQMPSSMIGSHSGDDLLDNSHRRGNIASSSASSSSSGGYSRISSSVSDRDGRIRGIVSETRNGRTKIHKFGRDFADESDDSY